MSDLCFICCPYSMGNNNCTSTVRESDEPPPIPPKPRNYQNQHSNTCSSDKSDQQIYAVVDGNAVLGDPKPIGDLVTEFSNHLPLCFSVNESMYGICGDRSLMEGQLLSVHFQKKMKVLEVKSKQFDYEYTLPLCSSLSVSVLYNPEDKPDRAKKGYSFDEVAQLMNANPMPNCVCVVDSFKDLDKNAVQESDVLFIEKFVKNESGDYLVCKNACTGKSLRIGDTSNGRFCTATELISMSLITLIKLVKLPVDVVFSSPKDGSIVLPPSDMNRVYTIMKEREEKSLIASTKYTSEDDSHPASSVQTIEIFLSLPLDVQLVKLTPSEIERLRVTTKTLFDTFQPSYVSEVICDLDSSINFVQTALYKAIKTDSWNDGVTLSPPIQPSNSTSSAFDEDDDYTDMNGYTIPQIASSYIRPSNYTMRIPQSQSSTFPRNHSKQLPQVLPASPNTHHTLAEDVSPYLITHRGSGNSLRREIPSDYAKFSASRQIQREALHKELLQFVPPDDKPPQPKRSTSKKVLLKLIWMMIACHESHNILSMWIL